MPPTDKRHIARQQRGLEQSKETGSISRSVPTLKEKVGAKRAASEQKDSTKRRRGHLDAASTRKIGPATKPAYRESKGVSFGNPDDSHAISPSDDELLQEIRALGGDEEDLALIDEVDSGSEIDLDGPPPPAEDKSLDLDLKAYAAQLGLGAFQNPVQEGGLQHESPRSDRTSPEPLPMSTSANRQSFIFEPRSDWHAADLTRLSPSSDELKPFAITPLGALQDYAKTLLEVDASLYRESVLGSSSHKFLSTIVTSGTLSDKISALTLAIQESPVHNVKAFETLVSLASKRSRSQAIAALEALVDLLGPGLILPPNRRLCAFNLQPGLFASLKQGNSQTWRVGDPLPGKLTEKHLISWVYEDWLKTAYFKVIQLLEVWCNDEVEYSRMRSLDFVFGLLKDKPEQEQNLLRLLVNKLGDKERKIASRVSYLLLQLQTMHPGMKRVVINEIENEVLLRPGQGPRAKYYAVNTLNQTILSSREPDIVESLVRIYFTMFISLLDRQEPKLRRGSGSTSLKDTETHPVNKTAHPSLQVTEEEEKLISAILTGINRASPFLATGQSILDSQVDTLFRVAHSTNFNTSVQALMLIQQMSSSRQIAVDRFYRTLYESLLDPRLVTSSKQALYLNLLSKALRSDVDARRVKAFVKRMLQTLNLHQPPFICGMLYIIAQLKTQYPDISALLVEPEDNECHSAYAGLSLDGTCSETQSSPEMIHQSDQAKYNGRKRDPEFSNADRSCLWDLEPILAHFHPSVSILALNLLSLAAGETPKPQLESHTLIRFLDKFVYRKSKAADKVRGASIMQPVRSQAGSGAKLRGSLAVQADSSHVNCATFWNKTIEQVAAEDIFFHEYFKRSRKAEKEIPIHQVSANESSDENEIWMALTSSHPDGSLDAEDESDLEQLGRDAINDDSDLSDIGQLIAELSDDSVNSGYDWDSEDGDGRGSMDDEPQKSRNAGFAQAELPVGTKAASAGTSKRQKLKELPTFAAASDYAELLSREEDA